MTEQKRWAEMPVSVKALEWTQADAERENSAFTEWFKERGYHDYPDLYPLTTENAMHAAWQEAAKRSSLLATPKPEATEGGAHEKARDCGVDGGPLLESRDCIGAAYTRSLARGLMRETRISLVARTIRQSLRKYGHKVAESTLPECIAADVERSLVAHQEGEAALTAKPEQTDSATPAPKEDSGHVICDAEPVAHISEQGLRGVAQDYYGRVQKEKDDAFSIPLFRQSNKAEAGE